MNPQRNSLLMIICGLPLLSVVTEAEAAQIVIISEIHGSACRKSACKADSA